MKYILRSTRVLIGPVIIAADVHIDDEIIVRVDSYGHDSAGRQIIDVGDRLITPGFVDLHSDAVEKEIEPRPGAQFPVRSSLVELDKKLAMAGITTMFHAIAFNEEALVGLRGTQAAAQLITCIGEMNRDSLDVDNLVHARYELTSFSSVPMLIELMDNNQIHLLSLMDHSPGQGQFKSLDTWKQYHMPVYDLTEHEIAAILNQQANKKARSAHFIDQVLKCARNHNLIIASHDDDSCEKIEMMAAMGVTIAEFPLNIKTAQHARAKTMTTGMGAPNVVRGRSQSGNISARELIRQNCCDFLCSDYHPTSLLQAVYTLHRELEVELGEAFAYITANPARIGGLPDRGTITGGKLADLVVIDDASIPRVTATIKSGKIIYNGSNPLTPHYEQHRDFFSPEPERGIPLGTADNC